MAKYELRPTIKTDYLKLEKDLSVILNKIGFTLIETYPGIRYDKIIKQIKKINKNIKIINSMDFTLLSIEKFREYIYEDLTDDRVFGKFTNKKYEDSFDLSKIETFIKKNKESNIVIIGLCSYLFKTDQSKLIYVDLPRWEIQQRYRDGEGVFYGGAIEEDTLRNFKRGYFIEWRMADAIKKKNWNDINYYIDGSNEEKLKIINKGTLDSILENGSKRPFRMKPYFDAGVWGGKWMQEKFNLGTNKHSKWAWGFDGVPEENSIIFESNNGDILEMPAINMVFFKSKNLLGEYVFNKFGAEFPIRFDLLDTIKGDNLSLQVHPTTRYIKEQFRALYTQEESYYILDTDQTSNPACYLGLKNDASINEFVLALNKAQKTNIFNVEKYVNKFPVKKHDHISHPAGCVHSSARGCMVLEISTTPYIFTFKLWDWGRVDFDGKPRPINIEHGKKVIDKFFNTDICKAECISPIKVINESDGVVEEHTGLHSRQFIETRRFTLENNVETTISTHGSVNVLNLVDGEQAIIQSIDNSFESLIINYAETFIIPEFCKIFTIKSTTNTSIKLLQAFIRKN